MEIKLSAKQQNFVNEYLIDFNGAQAAIRAGYSAKTAKVIAAENLTKPYIKAALDKAIKARTERTMITQDKVLADIAAIKANAMTLVLDKEANSVMLNHSAALRACELEGKHLSMFADQIKVEHSFEDRLLALVKQDDDGTAAGG